MKTYKNRHIRRQLHSRKRRTHSRNRKIHGGTLSKISRSAVSAAKTLATEYAKNQGQLVFRGKPNILHHISNTKKKVIIPSPSNVKYANKKSNKA